MHHFDWDEKREVERVATERPVTLFFGNEKIAGKMIDLSVVGAGIISDRACASDDRLQLEFSLPSMGAQSLRMKAKVVHATTVRGKCLMGLTFDPKVKANQIVISEYMRYHNRETL